MGSEAKNNLLRAGFLGGILGGCLAMMIGASLAEISQSSTFALMFGICLLLIGGVLIGKVYTTYGIDRWKNHLILFLAIIILISGLLCFLLDENWFNDFSVNQKVPLYCTLSMSLSLVMGYVLLEYINLGLCTSCCSLNATQGYIHGKPQTMLYFGLILLMGLFFGLTFGLTDAEDDMNEFRKQQRSTVPVGVIGGMAIGSLTEYLHQGDDDDNPHYENTLHVDIDDNF